MDTLFEDFPIIYTILTTVFFIFLYYAVKFVLSRQVKGNTDTSLIRSIILFLIVLTGIISVILAIPMSPEIKKEVTNIIGIVISAVLALSSATFIGNALAGIMLKLVKNFKPGDFVLVNDIYGRVTEMGLFHTEVQTENRDLTTLPNLFLASNPVKVTRSSGTFIFSEVSLGYDVDRHKIEKALIKAATEAGLKDPFVLITSLGDFTIVYKVQGLLENVKTIISSKSRLNAMVVDELHKVGIEIVSPGFVNQRQVNETVFIPKFVKQVDKAQEDNSAKAENKIFDKANEAEGIESRKQYLQSIDTKLAKLNEELKAAESPEAKEAIQKKIASSQEVKQKLIDRIDSKIDELAKE